MEFRKSVKSDIPEIMGIIKQAQDYFKEKNIDQWQNGYPNKKDKKVKQSGKYAEKRTFKKNSSCNEQ